MTNRKTTKRALLTSVTALALCVVMLVGTTFAWFTDTAKTNVNKIQAGNLDVELQVQRGNDWVDAKDKTLEWVKAEEAPANEAILWEPGASYDLEPFRIVNKGNLNLKYKVVITGATGDVELLNVIDFEGNITESEREPVATQANTFPPTVNMNDNEPVVVDRVLAPGQYDEVTLNGTMQTTAGNTYMNKTVSGISITVYAAQATGEYDSFRNDYDADAAYPTVAPVLNTTDSADVTVSTDNKLPETTIEANGATSTIPANTTMKNGEDAVTATGAGTLERVITTKVTSVGDNDVATYDISYNFVQGETSTAVTEFSNVVTNKIQLSAGLTEVKVTHTHGSATENMTPASSETANGDGYFYYNATTGLLTIWSSKYSSFAVSYKVNFAAAIGDQYFATLTEAVKAAKDGDTIVLVKDSVGSGIGLYLNPGKDKDGNDQVKAKNLTIDFNGHTYEVSTPAVGSKTYESQGFHLEWAGKGNSNYNVTFKNGTIAAAKDRDENLKLLIQNYCNLTLDNMVIDGRNLVNAYDNGTYTYVMSNNCGNVVIDNTTILANERSVAFDVYGGFGKYGDVTVTVTGNSVINGDIEIDHGNANSNINTLVLGDCTVNGNIKKINGTLNFAGNVTLNGDVKITDKTDKAANRTVVTKPTTLNLNGKIYGPKDMGNNNTNFTVLFVDADTTINASGDNGINAQTNGGYGINVRNGATLTINGGYYYGGGTAVQVQKGTLIINDGSYACEPYSDAKYGYKFLINCIDAAHKDGTAKIFIKGGTFAYFDPADSESENPHGNFVAEGYISTKAADSNTWTVTKNA